MSIAYVPPAPRELSRAARRRIFVRERLDSYWAGGIFVIAGFLFMIPFCWGLPVDIAIAIAGREARGSFVSYGSRSNVTINGEHPSTVRFQYPSRDGVREVVSTEPDRSLLDEDPQKGVELPIEVFEPIPGWARAKGARNAIFGPVTLVFAIAPAVGLAMMFAVWFTRHGLVRAFVHGHFVVGRVDSIEPVNTPSGEGVLCYKLNYSYEVGGLIRKAAFFDHQLEPLEALAQGDKVPVLYDPRDPSTSTLWIAPE